MISTIAGTGVYPYNGDNIQATSATLDGPCGVAVNSDTGDVYIADTSHHRIRKITVSTGIITSVAGTGTSSYNGDNAQATSAALNFPWSIDIDSAGNIYIADGSNSRIRKVSSTSGYLSTIAGNGISSYSGDGDSATSASVNNPFGVAVDSSGIFNISLIHRICSLVTHCNHHRQRVCCGY